ncbi:hypothetical protein VTJ04DRAFT_265 [Mycothermus thermophilus]|uniref:uncharacterized protein n=1 Tax=Humicola insolens TaxID=85995 RepID=UPI0037443DB8
MASLAAACRMSARVAARTVRPDAAVRGFRTSSAALAAQNFTMPALSPTMTEGNIAAWRVKEGEAFQAGDVLLEIETDKATMDVEAQEPGILMKVVQPDGAKGVRVGTRIAVIAEEGDDISTLEIPPDEPAVEASAPKTSSQPTSAPAQAATTTTTTAAAPTPATPAPSPAPSSSPSAPAPSFKSAPRRTDPNHTLLPSVIHLLQANGIDPASAPSQIRGTGPHGRILKGDVLAYLGKIDARAPKENSARFDKLAHLDLSNIKVAPPAAKPAAAKEEGKKAAAAEEAPAVPEKRLVSVQVSLTAVVETQRKIRDTLGVNLPLTTFISRAADLANKNLPVAPNRQPTPDELFDQLVGSATTTKAAAKVSRGTYKPDVGLVKPQGFTFTKPAAVASAAKKKVDIIDILAAPSSKAQPAHTSATAPSSVLPGLSYVGGQHVFSLRVPPTEVKRASTFLESVKRVLENEPGRLVL